MSRFSIVVFSSLFPSSVRKGAGLFVRERMFRVREFADLVVVSPIPWFPGQSIIRLFKKDYRPQPQFHEIQDGVDVYYPRFFSVPVIFRWLDASMMARCSLRLVKRLKEERNIQLIDSHFSYPDGLAATWLGKKLNLKVTITMRGTEVPHSHQPNLKAKLLSAWQQADKVFSVSNSLRLHAISLGAESSKFKVIGNGVDVEKFKPMLTTSAREKLGISNETKVLITVGGIVERKGFHRVVACLPELLKSHPDLIYLIVGGANSEGNYKPVIEELAEQLGVTKHVRFLGAIDAKDLYQPLSAADVFILSTRNEGWANVILESMACGTPVIATDVGGCKEVVNDQELGTIVEFDHHPELLKAIQHALAKKWDKEFIIDYANNNGWNKRVSVIESEFRMLLEDVK